MIISIASGKGGTGKTTISVALAESLDTNNVLIDCDVEEPNTSIFLDINNYKNEDVNVLIPIINDNCTACGKCSNICYYNAIANLKEKAMVFTELCHSCGGCSIICPENAISEIPKTIGKIKYGNSNKIDFCEGRIGVGHLLTPAVIKAAKKHVQKDRINILDCPPGTACPMVTAVCDTDYVILVTEPTPFGLNDLVIAIDTVKEINIPFGVVINKYDGNTIIDDFCSNNSVKILGRISEDKEIAKAYSVGKSLIKAAPYLRDTFNSIIENIISEVTL